MTYGRRGLVAGIVFLAVALMPVAAVAGPLEDGMDAHKSGDYATALRLWRALAEQGHADAQFALGFMLERGQGAPQDRVQAHMLYSLAASSLPPGEDYDTAVRYRDTVAAEMTPTQITEAQKLAREWSPQ